MINFDDSDFLEGMDKLKNVFVDTTANVGEGQHETDAPMKRVAYRDGVLYYLINISDFADPARVESLSIPEIFGTHWFYTHWLHQDALLLCRQCYFVH